MNQPTKSYPPPVLDALVNAIAEAQAKALADTQVLKAYEFAKHAHESRHPGGPQLRKYTYEPYIVHPVDVMAILKNCHDEIGASGNAGSNDTSDSASSNASSSDTSNSASSSTSSSDTPDSTSINASSSDTSNSASDNTSHNVTSNSTAQTNDNMYVAALLHDTVEDTDVTLEEIRDVFGERIGQMVEGLTDIEDPAHNRKTRKRINCERLARQDAETQTVKLADLLSNLADIRQHDEHFLRVYVREKLDILCAVKETVTTRQDGAALFDIALAQAKEVCDELNLGNTRETIRQLQEDKE